MFTGFENEIKILQKYVETDRMYFVVVIFITGDDLKGVALKIKQSCQSLAKIC